MTLKSQEPSNISATKRRYVFPIFYYEKVNNLVVGETSLEQQSRNFFHEDVGNRLKMNIAILFVNELSVILEVYV